jgi:type I restriction enzyme S subunit
MELKPGYKQTEVGVIPEDWKVVLLDSVSRRASGHTPDKAHHEYWGGDIKWVSLADSHRLDNLYIHETTATITAKGIANSSANILPAGSCIVSRDAGVGKSAILAEDMAVSQHFMAWHCGPRLDNHYLYFLLQAMKPELERIAIGNTIKTIGLPYFRSLRIPLPSIEEQQAIATALLVVEQLVRELVTSIAKKRGIKQAATQELLSGKRRLPGFGGEWEVKRLDSIADVLKGHALSKSLMSASGARPCILYGELFTNYGRVICDVAGRTNSSEGNPSKSGDVLMPGSTTTTGADLATATALLVDDVALGGDILIVRPKGKSYDPVFLANYLTHARKNEIAELTQGITIHHLYGKDLKKLLLQLPTLPEQAAIATILSEMDAELAALETRRDKTRELKQGMMQELLAGRTRL